MRRSIARCVRRTQAHIPALTAEVESASQVLTTPAARVIAEGEERLLLLEEVEALLATKSSRSWTRAATSCDEEDQVVSLAKRPVLFTLARALGEAWPEDVPRDVLVARAFRAKLRTNRIARDCASKIARLRTMLKHSPR